MPWPWAGRSTAWASAASTVSAIRCDVSTLPATTAAGGCALTRRALGRLDLERRVGARVGRDVGRQQHAQREVAGRARHRERAVDVARHLVGGALEVDRAARRRRPSTATAIGTSSSVTPSPSIAPLGLVAAVGQLAQRLARAPLGVGEHLVERRSTTSRPRRSTSSAQPPPREPVGGDLGAQVAAADAGRAHVGEDQLEHVVARAAAAGSRAPPARFARVGRHRARAHAADVGVVRARDREAEDLAVDVDRRDERDVGQVRAAAERVVEDQDVARRRARARSPPPPPRASRRGGRGCARPARPSRPCGVEQRGRAVAALLDVRRVGAADQHRAHLLGDARQRAGEHATA